MLSFVVFLHLSLPMGTNKITWTWQKNKKKTGTVREIQLKYKEKVSVLTEEEVD